MAHMHQSNKYEIRASTDADMDAIYVWLTEHRSRGVEATFHCNWTLTLSCHNEGRLIVCIDRDTGTPVAYQWGGLLNSGILEVREDLRGHGIGKLLVERRISEAHAAGKNILYIQCTPESSIPFWRKMGFTPYEVNNVTHAYQVLPRKNPIPSSARPVDVSICFYPEAALYEEDVPTIAKENPEAVIAANGTVYLGTRVSCFDYPDLRFKDLAVEIHVEGERRYFGKAKRSEAKALGVMPCANGYYLDSINRLNA